MKWEAIKKACAKSIYDDVKRGVMYAAETAIFSLKKMQDNMKITSGYKTITEFAEAARDKVLNWDIRNIDELASFFPKAVPSFVKNGNYSIELGEDGWDVYEKIKTTKYADGGTMADKKVDKIEVPHALILMQDAIEYVESNTEFVINDAPNEEKAQGKKYHLMRTNGVSGYEDMGYMTEREVLDFAKEKGFGNFRNIDVDALINAEAERCGHLECDGATKILHYLLDSHNIPHYVFYGTLEVNSKIMNPHFWIGLPDGRYVDFKARMWFGNDAPNGIFYPKDTTAIYTGTPVEMKVSATLYKLLLHTV